jgi:tetratricopeptide (TPR) repeat protein
MSEGFLLGLLFKIAPSLLTTVAKAGVQSLLQQTPVTKAINATCESFPDLEPLRHTLENWCKSKDFAQILEQVKAGSRSISQNDVITSFNEVGSFYTGDNTRASAEQVLNTFAAKLEEQLYVTDDSGAYYHAQREEVLHSDTRNRLERIDEHVIAVEQTQREILSRLPSSEDQNQTRSANEIHLHAKVDAARDLLNRGQPRAARLVLDELRKELASRSASAQLLFRVATNLGACALQFNEYETANKEFVVALGYQPTSVKGLANCALAKLLLGKPEDAFLFSKQACQIDNRDPHATSIYIRALHELNRSGEVESLLRDEPWILEEPTCTLTLASIRFEQKRYSDAESLSRASLHRTPDETQSLMLLAQAIITPIQKELNKDPPLRWRIPEQTQNRLHEAETLLTKATDLLQHHDTPTRLHAALAGRAVVRIMLSRYEDALADCDRILAEDSTHEQALGNKAILLLKLDRTTESIKILERLKSEPESHIPLALAYVDNKEPEKAIAILRSMFEPDKHDDLQLQITDNLLSAYNLSRNESAAEEIIRSIKENWPNDARGLTTIARYRRKQGKNEDAIALLREGLAYANDNFRDLIALQLADIYYSLERFSEAAELYGEIVDKTEDNPITRKYLISLFNAGSFRETLLLAQSLRGNHDAIPVVTELEGLVMQYIGDLDRAMELFEKLSRVEPQNIMHRVRVVLLHLRRGNRETAERILSKIRPADISDGHALIQVAQARAHLGMTGSLEFAYRARRVDPRNPEVHLGYVGLLLRREVLDKTLLEADQIVPGCTAHLRNGDRVQIFTIVDDAESNLLSGELSPSDPLARKLMGLRKGDRLVLREGLEDLSYEIADVQTKYVFALQETLLKFSTWFPDHTGLFKVEFKEGDLSKVKLALDARQHRGAQVLSLYRDKQLTLGAFARLVGTPLIDVWAGLINRTDGVILASTGAGQEQQQEISLIRNADETVLDLTSILTLAYLNLLEELPHRFKGLFVPQALLDEIDETIARNFVDPRPVLSVWKENETYFRKEITPEDYERGRKFLEGIRKFVQTHCTLTPTRTALDVGKVELEQMQNLLGNDAIAAILVAKETTLPLYSDDLGLRLVARNDWKVSGFWTQTLLLDLRDKGLLGEERYRETVQNLVLANYRFVSIDGAGLLWILKTNSFLCTPAVTRVFESLHGPECSDESAVLVLANLVKRIWLEPMLYEQKLLLLDLVLNTLTTGRDLERILNRFKISLKGQFALIPQVLRPISQSIDLWAQQRSLRSGIIQPS